MKVSKYIVVPALVAVALFAVSTAYAGDAAKNGEGEVIMPVGGEGEHTKNGGGDNEHSKNGGGEGEHTKNGENYGNGGGNGEHTKNGGGVTPPAPTPPPVASPPPGGGGGHSKNGGGKVHQSKRGGGGTGSVHVRQRAQVVCVIDGQIVYVRRVQDCAYQPETVVQYVPRKTKKVRRQARVAVQQCTNKNGGDGYVVMQQPQVQYYSPASPAATKQARKRAARAAASYGYGDGYYVQPQVVVKQYRKKRKVRYAQPIYMPAPDQSGVVIHYGPLVSKGGAY